MVINPKLAIEKGWIKFPNWMDEEFKQKCIQQCGVDITVDDMFILDSNIIGHIGEDIRTFKKCTKVYPSEKDSNQVFHLHQNFSYDWSSDFIVNVPTTMFAIINVRSSLNRVGIGINAGIFDPGFTGNIGAQMRLFAGSVDIQHHCRVAQILFFPCSAASTYNGIYNNLCGNNHWSDEILHDGSTPS